MSLLGHRVSKAIRVAFDVSQTGFRKAGCGFFAHSLCKSLIKRSVDMNFTLLGSYGSDLHSPFLALAPPMIQPNISWGPRHLLRRQSRSFWLNKKKVNQLASLHNIIHANNFWCPYDSVDSKLIYTIYDTSFLDHPDWHLEKNRIICFSGMQRASVYADYFVAISYSARESFLKYFPYVNPDKVKVVYPSSRFSDYMYGNLGLDFMIPSRLRFLSPTSFFLSVGTLEPRKNQLFLLKAYDTYRQMGGDPYPLVFAGGKGWLFQEFINVLHQYQWSSDIYMLGYVSEKELAWLYKNCLLNLYPSLYEGFGMPVLEGMSFGCPTIAANTTSLPEVLGNAGLLISPYDCDLWALTMQKLSSDRHSCDTLSQLACERSKLFSWDMSADKLLDIYEQAAVI